MYEPNRRTETVPYAHCVYEANGVSRTADRTALCETELNALRKSIVRAQHDIKEDNVIIKACIILKRTVKKYLIFSNKRINDCID